MGLDELLVVELTSCLSPRNWACLRQSMSCPTGREAMWVSGSTVDNSAASTRPFEAHYSMSNICVENLAPFKVLYLCIYTNFAMFSG